MKHQECKHNQNKKRHEIIYNKKKPTNQTHTLEAANEIFEGKLCESIDFGLPLHVHIRRAKPETCTSIWSKSRNWKDKANCFTPARIYRFGLFRLLGCPPKKMMFAVPNLKGQSGRRKRRKKFDFVKPTQRNAPQNFKSHSPQYDGPQRNAIEENL